MALSKGLNFKLKGWNIRNLTISKLLLRKNILSKKCEKIFARNARAVHARTVESEDYAKKPNDELRIYPAKWRISFCDFLCIQIQIVKRQIDWVQEALLRGARLRTSTDKELYNVSLFSN